MDIHYLREKIDEIDSTLLSAFIERMDISADVAAYKAEKGLPIYDPARERQKLSSVLARTPEKYTQYAAALYSLLFELSRTHQDSIVRPSSLVTEQIQKALETTQRLFPQSVPVACQGVEGAFSQLACEKLFTYPNIMFCNSFESVFSAIDAGLCRYGVLPLENSTAGSINKVYDLMMRHRFYIVRSVRLKVDHNLLAKKGAALSGIKEIYSHAQAISQCSGFLQSLTGVKVIECENTAAAAKLVAESERTDIAALSSRYCADLYGLVSLKDAVQDQGNNYTRFI
ncbi:MAG TPA: bifunctional chorismate mutase/prephenate dehydratase, partial [Papillibacter sp.]|nr:bifunctional chorismate mutase/prephenate dehydratase [Papillibacter sp.]